MKKYKALLTDVDGTLIPNSSTGRTSVRVKKAIFEAKKILHVGVASGRPLLLLSEILKELDLHGPSIILGGSKIIDSKTFEVLWEKPMVRADILKLYKIFKEHDLPLSNDDDYKNVRLNEETIPETAYSLFTGNIGDDKAFAEKIVAEVSGIPNLSAHIVPGWGGGYAINTTHAMATKQHGVYEVSKILGIDPGEMIGIGDSGNDFPLLMSCGLKVAMGNASDELKAIADYVAPSVEEDGVAEVIEKFVLEKK